MGIKHMLDQDCIGRPLSRTALFELTEAAIAWWRTGKPAGWSDADYLRDPTVSCVTDADKRLARAISNAIQAADARWNAGE